MMRRTMLLVATMALTLLVASGVALAVTKIGTNGPDHLRGTNGDDILIGRGGNDVLNSLAGHDELLGGRGKDVVVGGKSCCDESDFSGGNKNLLGGPGNDAVVGGLEHLATRLGGVAGCGHECLLAGPEEEDHRSQRTGHTHLRGRQDLRRGRLLGQALRRRSARGKIPRAEKAPRIEAQARPSGEEAAGSGPPGATGGNTAAEA